MMKGAVQKGSHFEFWRGDGSNPLASLKPIKTENTMRKADVYGERFQSKKDFACKLAPQNEMLVRDTVG